MRARVNKAEEIRAAPSDDLDFPRGSRTQGTKSIHESYLRSAEVGTFHDPERKTLDSPHFSIVQRHRPNFTGIHRSKSLKTVRRSFQIGATATSNAVFGPERT
jgi:hypothetical protein